MLNLEDKRTWLIGGGAAAAVVAGAGWFFVVSPPLSDTSSLRSQTAAAQQQTLQTQQKLDKLIAERKNLGTYKLQLVQSLAGLPVDTALPEFTRQLSAQAQAAGVRLQGVTIGAIAPVTATGGTAGATDTGTAPNAAAGSTSTGGTGGTTATPGSGAPAAVGGPVSIQVTVNSTGGGDRQLAFLHLIQAGPRRALVSSFNFTAGGANAGPAGGTTMTLQLTVFATPKTAADQARLLKLLAAK